MKKLVVMLGVACVALLSQAASIDWALSATKSNKNYGADPEYQRYVKSVPILIPLIPLYSVEKYKWLVA